MSCILVYSKAFFLHRDSPEITWKLNNVKLKHENDSMEIPEAFQGRRLIIVKVQRDLHEGTYTCEAENSQGSAQPKTTRLVVEGMCNMNLAAVPVRNK